MEKGWDPRARKCISLVLSAVSSSFDNDVMGAEGAPSGDAAAAWLLDTLECVVPTAGVPLGEPVLLFFAAVFTLVTVVGFTGTGGLSITLILRRSFSCTTAADAFTTRFTTSSGILVEVRSTRILPARAAESLRGAEGRACVVVRIYNSESPGLVWRFKGKNDVRMWMPCERQRNLLDWNR